MSAVLHITVVTHQGMKVNLVNFANRWDAEDAKKELLDNYEGLEGADIRVTVLNGGSV